MSIKSTAKKAINSHYIKDCPGNRSTKVLNTCCLTQSAIEDANTPYSIDEHSHTFAVWAAARAAHQGCKKINHDFAKETLSLPQFEFSPTFIQPPSGKIAFDEWHHKRCLDIIASAKASGITKKRVTIKKRGSTDTSLPYGVAAKLLNIYLKARCLLGQPNPSSFIHPPIDSKLIEGIIRSKIAGSREEWEQLGSWSEFDEMEYISAIEKIREAIKELKSNALWKIEEYWKL